MTTSVEQAKVSVVGVRFKEAGRISYFDSNDLELDLRDDVVVDTGKGREMGWVVIQPQAVIHTEGGESLHKVLRRATEEDYKTRRELEEKEERALKLAKELARELSSPMKFLDARYTLDGGRLTLQFGAEERVDFRSLLRRLGESLRTKVELKQIGPRDEAKVLGGLGRCGLALCCARWLTEFSPVTIRMAKEQALPISAEHLTGQCGRLKCCLRFEYEQYAAINRMLPKIGEWVDTPQGPARVIVGHAVRETVSVLLEGEATVELPIAQVARRERRN